MKRVGELAKQSLMQIDTSFLPFADVASAELPWSKLLRLSLFQVTVGMAVVLLIGTLNRVMIVELGVPAWLVAVMISLPLIFAPFRAVIGFKSDTHHSVLGWRRVPYLWYGTMLQFGGLAIMPFALILLSGDSLAPPIFGQAAAGLAFLLVGAGLHTVQTVGLALATDLAPKETHPRVVTLMCGMLLVGMVISAVAFGFVLADFSELRLIQVVQASAAITMVVNSIALWKQEPRNPERAKSTAKPPSFRDAWNSFVHQGQSTRALIVVGIGTVGFSMQDVLLEPYGGQILHLAVGTTTKLTALLAIGGICGFVLSARLLGRGMEPYRLAGWGVVAGLAAFTAVLTAAPAYSLLLFGAGTALIGFGSALFVVGTLSAAMGQAQGDLTGLALGSWGAVQAFAAGAAIAVGGVLRDAVSALAQHGLFGPALARPVTGYAAVYLLEIVLLLATLIAVLPLARRTGGSASSSSLRPA
jgi:BCD family chlorophyll transporter-like MFS transporter